MSVRQNYFARRFPRTIFTLLWIWFVIITICTAVFATFAIRELVDPGGDGHVGIATITTCNDSHGNYRACYGNFASRDGRVRLSNVSIAGESAAQVGSRFTAYGEPHSNTVTVASSGGERFTDIYVTIAFLIAWLVLFRLCVYKPARRRRAQRLSQP